MNRQQYYLMEEKRFGSIIPGLDRKKNKNHDKEHKKDDAVEEYADDDADEKSRENSKEKEKGGKGMGRSDKARKQNSDESDSREDRS